MTNAINTTTTKLPTGFGRISVKCYTSAQQVIKHLQIVDDVRRQCNERCDYEQGRILVQAKANLPHGEYEKACKGYGFSQQDAYRLAKWYQTIQSPKFGDLDVAKAEQTMSRGARTEFCSADADTQAVIAVAVSDPETTKITAKQIKLLTNAPAEVREQVVAIANSEFPTDGPDYADRMIEHVRSLINPETWEIDTSGHTDEQKDDMLKQLNTTLEATQSMFAMYNMQTQPYFGGIGNDGRYDWYDWFTIIKNVSNELTNSERIKAIKHLLSQLDEADRQKLVDSILSPIN